MSSKKKSAPSARVGDAHEKSTDELSVKEFRDRFCIPNGVIVELLNGEDVVSTEKAEQDIIVFSKEQFNAGLRFPCRRWFMEIPPFHQDSTRLHSSQYYPGADGMQHHQHAVQPRPHTVGDSTKGGAKGQVMVRGAWAGSRHPTRPFSPNYSLAIPDRRQGEAVQDAADCAEPNAVVREPQEYVITFSPGRCQRR
ncbi:hypothetical protein CK203_053487 [Vitis vinifera]|uniref:Uncharacterized protein n=1 Tax=Vitis vinifera TaxID=29760 RepID=A0A438JDZ4_VITVI|nr:hypothetical protein CK203_053487 [Vitis vinifera]